MGYAQAFEVEYDEQARMYYIRQILSGQSVPIYESYTTNYAFARDMAIAYSGCTNRIEWENMKARARA